MLNKILKIKNFDYNKINYSKQINTKLFAKNTKFLFKIHVNDHNKDLVNDHNKDLVNKEEINKVITLLNDLPYECDRKINTKFIEDNHKIILKEWISYPSISTFSLAYPISSLSLLYASYGFSNFFLLKCASVISGFYLVYHLNKFRTRDDFYKFNCLYPKFTEIYKYTNIEKYRKDQIYKVLLWRNVEFEGNSPLIKESVFDELKNLYKHHIFYDKCDLCWGYYDYKQIEEPLNKLIKNNEKYLESNLQEILAKLFKDLEYKCNSDYHNKPISNHNKTMSNNIKFIIKILVNKFQPDLNLKINKASLKNNLSHYEIYYQDFKKESSIGF